MAYADSIRTTDYTREELANLIDGNRFVGEAVATAGTPPNYTLTLTPAPSSYYYGMTISFLPHADFTGSAGTVSTINVNGLGAKNLYTKQKWANGVRTVYPGELLSNGPYFATYNGTEFIVHTPTYGGLSLAYVPILGSQAGTATLGLNFTWQRFLNANTLITTYYFQVFTTAITDWISATLPRTSDGIHAEQAAPSRQLGLAGLTRGAVHCEIDSTTLVKWYRDDGVGFPASSPGSFYLFATVIYSIA